MLQFFEGQNIGWLAYVGFCYINALYNLLSICAYALQFIGSIGLFT